MITSIHPMRFANIMVLGITMISLLVSGCGSDPFFQLKQGGFGGRPLFQTVPEKKDYKELGPVRAKAMGFIWEGCNGVETKVMDLLINQARNVGGDAVVGVRRVSCTKLYWPFLLYVVGGLGPWMVWVEMDGLAIKQGG